MLQRLALLALFSLLLLPAQAMAHKPSDSYLTLQVTDEAVEGRWDIALRDLEEAVGLDRDQDGALTWGEVQAGHEAIAAYALARLGLRSAAGDCVLTAKPQLIEDHSDGAYSVLPFAALCPGSLDELTLRYQLLFDIDSLHRGLLQVTHAGETAGAVLSPERSSFRWVSGQGSVFTAFIHYLEEGVWHIWIGFDHILFLLTLLLAAVVHRKREEGGLSAALIATAKIVTAFTLAHSITLSAAALDLVSLPSGLVEASIAVSIMVCAANNLRPFLTKRLWLVAFGFGLIHGFGFAGVLADLGLPADVRVTALVGFNLGVEIGQLAIVAAAVPLFALLRTNPASGLLVLRFGSVAVFLLASLWLAERSFGVALLMS